MNNLDLSWNYQTKQIELERYEKKVKDTPLRRRLITLQRFLQQGQKLLSDVEKQAKLKENRISEIENKSKSYIDDLEDLNKDFSYYSECDPEELDEKEITQAVKEAERLGDNISNLRKTISRLRQEVEVSDAKIRDNLMKMRQAKAEYDKLYKDYQVEAKSIEDDLAEKKSVVEKAAEGIPADIMAEYNRIKANREDPVAILNGNICGGCNLQLPIGISSLIRNSDKLVRCENCGRILYIKE